jgi:hypothetical protein
MSLIDSPSSFSCSSCLPSQESITTFVVLQNRERMKYDGNSEPWIYNGKTRWATTSELKLSMRNIMRRLVKIVKYVSVLRSLAQIPWYKKNILRLFF